MRRIKGSAGMGMGKGDTGMEIAEILNVAGQVADASIPRSGDDRRNSGALLRALRASSRACYARGPFRFFVNININRAGC